MGNILPKNREFIKNLGKNKELMIFIKGGKGRIYNKKLFDAHLPDWFWYPELAACITDGHRHVQGDLVSNGYINRIRR